VHLIWVAEPKILRECLGRRRRLLDCNITPWPLVRERTIPTERPPLVDEI
jgi:hypothetical protein